MGAPKLTEEQVAEIKAAAPFKFDKQWEIQTAQKYGVSDDCIHDIVREKTWRHVK